MPEQSAEFRPPVFPEQLPPEVLDHVMGKVQDINVYGAAFSVVKTPDALPMIFQKGLLGAETGFFGKLVREKLPDRLGTRVGAASNIPSEVYPEFVNRWPEHIRKERKDGVFFNIVGRSARSVDESLYFTPKGFGYFQGQGVGLMFNAKDYKELGVMESYKQDKLNLPSKRGTYKARSVGAVVDSYKKRAGVEDLSQTTDEEVLRTLAGLESVFISEQGEIKANGEFGFTLFPRVSPKSFSGILVKNTEVINERNRWGSISTREEWKEEETLNMAKRIALIMQKEYKDKPELLLPVYDTRGNLLWPKKMSYEEVKQFVAQRDAKKADS